MFEKSVGRIMYSTQIEDNSSIPLLEIHKSFEKKKKQIRVTD